MVILRSPDTIKERKKLRLSVIEGLSILYIIKLFEKVVKMASRARRNQNSSAKVSRSVYELYRIYRGILNRINCLALNHEPLEDWNQRLNITHKHFIDELIFSKYSRIREYITDDFLDQLRQKRDLHWIGKIVTAELILRLVQNRWHPLTV